MKHSVQSRIAITLVAVSIISVIVLEAFAEKLRNIEWFDIDNLIVPIIICISLGTLLGWLSFRSRLGKSAALIGTTALLWAFLVFFSKS